MSEKDKFQYVIRDPEEYAQETCSPPLSRPRQAHRRNLQPGVFVLFLPR
jgi:hypothetical protein